MSPTSDMPGQEEHDKPENLVESSTELERRAARSLEDAADSNATLDGYFAINNERETKELDEEASKDRAEPGDREKGHPIP